MSNARSFFSETDLNNIKKAIQNAEYNTSGEIRVHIESKCTKPLLDRASDVFEMLEMHKTELRNGVLYYLAVSDRKFAILGDAGINQKVPENFWDEIKDKMLSKFKSGNFSEGLCEGIEMAGIKLKEHFPYQTDDVNELSDDISFGE